VYNSNKYRMTFTPVQHTTIDPYPHISAPQVIDLLVQILKFPLDGVPDEQNVILVFKEAYEILYTYMIGKSRKNALYFAKYIEFFQTQFTQKVCLLVGLSWLFTYISVKQTFYF